jgi:hypothetical protein
MGGIIRQDDTGDVDGNYKIKILIRERSFHQFNKPMPLGYGA